MGTFDTALMEALLSIGVPPERARSVVDAFDRSADARYSLHAQVLATKRDLSELETRLVSEIGETRERIAAVDARLDRTPASLDARVEATGARIETMDARMEASSAALAARIAETKADLLKWTLGALSAQTALLLSAIELL